MYNKTKWNEEEINFLQNNYEKYTHTELAKILNRTKNSVSIKLSKLGLKQESKYFYNRDFFKTIDTEEKAYWLGFLYADGYVVFSEETRNYEVGVELTKSDDKHLKKFNKSLNGNIEINYRTRNNDFVKCNITHSCFIRIYCREMTEDLIRHGCVPNKTWVKQLPILDNRLYSHFIRGYFDGNGSVYNRYDREGVFASISSASLQLMESFRKILHENNIKSYISEDKTIYKLGLSGKENSVKFLKYVYKDADIFLDRKYKIFGDNCLSI